MPEWKISRTWRKTEPLTLAIRKGSLVGISEPGLCGDSPRDSPTLGWWARESRARLPPVPYSFLSWIRV